ncbi:MAG: hypothetical protein EBY39_14995 [Flavobacteriia bacterium]|nr:hypothetical protein [Flavobacteriia bacterium]
MYDFDKNLTFIHIPKNAGTSVEIALGFSKLKGHSKHLPAYSHLGYGHSKLNHKEYPFSDKPKKCLVRKRSIDPKLIYFFASSHKFAVVRNPWDRLVSTWKYDTKFLEKDYVDLVPTPEAKSSRDWVDRRRSFITKFRQINGDSFCDFVNNLKLTWFGAEGNLPYININPDNFPKTGFFPYRWARWHNFSQCSFIHGPDNKLLVNSVLRFENLKQDWENLMDKLSLDIELPHENISNGKNYREYYDDEALVDIVARRYKQDIETFNYTFD